MGISRYFNNNMIKLATNFFILLAGISARELGSTTNLTVKQVKSPIAFNESIRNLSSLYYNQKNFLNNVFTEKQIKLNTLYSKTIGDFQNLENYVYIKSSDSKKCTDFTTNNVVTSAMLVAVDKNLKCFFDTTSNFEAFIKSNIMSSQLVETFPICYRDGLAPFEVLQCLDKEAKSRKPPAGPYNKFIHFLTNNQDFLNISMKTCLQNYQDNLEKSLVLAKDILVLCVVEKINDHSKKETTERTVLLEEKQNRNLTDLYSLKKDVLKTIEFKSWQMVQKIRFQYILDSVRNSTFHEGRGKNISCCLENYHKKIYSATDKATLRDSQCVGNQLVALDNLITQSIKIDNITLPFDSCFVDNSTILEICKCIDRVVGYKSNRVKDIYKNVATDFMKNADLLIVSTANNCLAKSSVILNEDIKNATMQLKECFTNFNQILKTLTDIKQVDKCVDKSFLIFITSSNDDVKRFQIKM